MGLGNMFKNVNGIKIEMTAQEEAEFEQSRIPDINSLKQRSINVRKNYLNKTDWYIVREADSEKACPEDIKTKRALARTEIDEIELADEITINNYSLNF